uniref:Uncharacterized protein n=1 Tax=Amphimedon queenslandica TaxID=400682 RepID=A0A1X7U0P2_AMPQE
MGVNLKMGTAYDITGRVNSIWGLPRENSRQAKGNTSNKGRNMAIGALIGGGAGATVGSIAGPPGTLVGGLVGAGVGAVVGLIA